MIINIREFIAKKKKENLDNRMRNMLQSDRAGVQKAMKEQAASKSIPGEAKEILSAEEIAALLQDISPSGFVYRVDLPGAVDVYRFINLGNYREFVDNLGHMEKDNEFLKAMCVIDKCEEFVDYDSMAKAFRVFEYVVRHNKTNTPVVMYARSWSIEMRKYLEELNLL